jgi:hypothetical protein
LRGWCHDHLAVGRGMFFFVNSGLCQTWTRRNKILNLRICPAWNWSLTYICDMWLRRVGVFVFGPWAWGPCFTTFIVLPDQLQVVSTAAVWDSCWLGRLEIPVWMFLGYWWPIGSCNLWPIGPRLLGRSQCWRPWHVRERDEEKGWRSWDRALSENGWTYAHNTSFNRE